MCRNDPNGFAEFDELPGMDQPWAAVNFEEVTAHWRSMVERDIDIRIVMLEFQLHALRNPELRERARTFARANARAIADYMLQRAVEVGEALPLPADDLAAVFGIASDGFAVAALIDPDTARLFGVMLDFLVRGVSSYVNEGSELGRQ